jgi:hypothetical protein
MKNSVTVFFFTWNDMRFSCTFEKRKSCNCTNACKVDCTYVLPVLQVIGEWPFSWLVSCYDAGQFFGALVTPFSVSCWSNKLSIWISFSMSFSINTWTWRHITLSYYPYHYLTATTSGTTLSKLIEFIQIGVWRVTLDQLVIKGLLVRFSLS